MAGLVTPGMRLADVGTDHGYVPIWLVRQGIIPSAVAMDIGKGPLCRAEEHIQEEGLADRIETRLSDGLLALKENEVDAMVAAGMGGGLVIHILSEGRHVAETIKEFILQPQSEIRKVREYLRDHGYRITREEMIFEDGKYYPMMKVAWGEEEALAEEELEFGKYLLREAHPVLFSWLQNEEKICRTVSQSLEGVPTERARKRLLEMQVKAEYLRRIRQQYFDGRRKQEA